MNCQILYSLGNIWFIISLLSVVFVHSMLSLNVGKICSIFTHSKFSRGQNIPHKLCLYGVYCFLIWMSIYYYAPSFSMRVHIVSPLSVCMSVPSYLTNVYLCVLKLLTLYFNGIYSIDIQANWFWCGILHTEYLCVSNSGHTRVLCM